MFKKFFYALIVTLIFMFSPTNFNLNENFSLVSKVYASDNWELAEKKLEEGNELSYEKDYQGAISKYTEAISLCKDFGLPYYNRGLTYYKLKKFEQAISDLTNYINFDPDDSKAYFWIGGSYFGLANYEKAINYYSKAIKIAESNKDLFKIVLRNSYYCRGRAYKNLKNYDDAISDFNKAIEIDPNYEVAKETREETYEELKKIR